MPQGYSEFMMKAMNIKEYDFMCNFYERKKHMEFVFLYNQRHADVSKVAANGGGGHIKSGRSVRFAKIA